MLVVGRFRLQSNRDYDYLAVFSTSLGNRLLFSKVIFENVIYFSHVIDYSQVTDYSHVIYYKLESITKCNQLISSCVLIVI